MESVQKRQQFEVNMDYQSLFQLLNFLIKNLLQYTLVLRVWCLKWAHL